MIVGANSFVPVMFFESENFGSLACADGEFGPRHVLVFGLFVGEASEGWGGGGSSSHAGSCGGGGSISGCVIVVVSVENLGKEIAALSAAGGEGVVEGHQSERHGCFRLFDCLRVRCVVYDALISLFSNIF